VHVTTPHKATNNNGQEDNLIIAQFFNHLMQLSIMSNMSLCKGPVYPAFRIFFNIPENRIERNPTRKIAEVPNTIVR